MSRIKHHPKNERIKRTYFVYLREARRRDEASIDAVAKALSRFEESTNHRDFSAFHREQAVAFKRKLDGELNIRTGKRLSRATVHSTLSALRSFFIWLADQPGYKSKVRYSDADYFNLSEKDVRIAKAVRERPAPTVEQIRRVLALMPSETAIQKRDRALVAATILTGARDGALASLKLKHLDLGRRLLMQDAREVKTKFSKTISTWFFPVGDDLQSILEDWVHYLRTELLWGDGDPLFPATHMALGQSGGFIANGLLRSHWSNADPIRRIFRQAFEAADLPNFPPHSFRHTLTQLGQSLCRTPEEFKAWSQNLGHEHVLTTLTSYGAVPAHRQSELILGLAEKRPDEKRDDLESRLECLERFMARNNADS